MTGDLRVPVCEPVSPTSIQRAKSLLHEPTNPALVRIDNEFMQALEDIDLSDDISADNAAATNEVKVEALKVATADSLELHMIDSKPYLDKLKKTQSLDEISELMKDFGASYGFEFELSYKLGDDLNMLKPLHPNL